MFTGIVEERGTLSNSEVRPGATRMRFEASTVILDASLGASIAVNGVCLTVVGLDDRGWSADVVDETLARTTLGQLKPGSRVNLERPLRLADRLGGHLVQGHVDAVGNVRRGAPDLVVAAPESVLRYVAVKGSIALDGVSLTVAALDDDSFSVAVIPHTAEVTTLGALAVGDGVNLEVDVIAKYTERLLGVAPGASAMLG